jgi:EAL and modified HD-GYP domain-containing signal transduction protein
MVRARMCELLAAPMGEDEPDRFFLVGLFSVLEGLMGARMDELLESLPLSEDIRAALIRGEGRGGELLRAVLAYERGDWDHVAIDGVEDSTIREAYLTAIAWADEARIAMGF